MALFGADGSPGSYAYIHYDRVAAAAAGEDLDPALILAYGVSHEVAHLLLGRNTHTGKGIMRGRWYGPELQRAARGQLRFTPEQSALIRAAVRGRNIQPQPN